MMAKFFQQPVVARSTDDVISGLERPLADEINIPL